MSASTEISTASTAAELQAARTAYPQFCESNPNADDSAREGFIRKVLTASTLHHVKELQQDQPVPTVENAVDAWTAELERRMQVDVEWLKSLKCSSS